MADLNNLTTLAKRLRPLLGSYIQNLGGQLVGEGPGIDIVKAGDVNTVGLGGDTVLLYHDDGSPVEEFATITLALAASVAGDVIELPAGIFIEDITIPEDVSVVSYLNNTYIYGTVTMGGNNACMLGTNVVVIGNSAGALAAIIGPTAGIASLFDVWIWTTNNGTGDAYGILGDDGEIKARNGGIDVTSIDGDAIGIYSPVDKLGDCYSNNNDVTAIASGAGDGWAFATDGADIHATDGTAVGSTAPVR